MDDILEAFAFEDLGDHAHAAAVERGVDDLEVAVFLAQLRAEAQGEQVGEVFLVHVGAHRLDLAAAQASLEFHHGRVGDLGHFGHDVLVDGRCHLAAVGPADLVAVVFLRVVGGGDHDAGHGALQAHRVAHFGRRADVVENIDVDAVGGQDVGRDAGKFLAVVAGVVGDDHLGVIVVAVGQDVVREALGGHADRVAVHAVGAHAHDAAEAAGAELEVLVEGVFEAGRVADAELLDLDLGFLVEITVEPGLCSLFKFFHVVIVLLLFSIKQI